MNTCLSGKKLVLFTRIQRFMVNAHTFNNHKSLVILMNCILNVIATCNFLFSDYVCTLLLQTIVVKWDYVPKKVQTLL